MRIRRAYCRTIVSIVALCRRGNRKTIGTIVRHSKEEIPRPVAMRRTLQTGRWGTSAVGEPTQNQVAANFEGNHRERGGGEFPGTPTLSRRWVELRICSTNKQNRSINASNAMFVPNTHQIPPSSKSMGDNRLIDAKLWGLPSSDF